MIYSEPRSLVVIIADIDADFLNEYRQRLSTTHSKIWSEAEDLPFMLDEDSKSLACSSLESQIAL